MELNIHFQIHYIDIWNLVPNANIWIFSSKCQYLECLYDLNTKPNLQTKRTKQTLPNQIYQTKPTKPNLPDQTYQNKPTEPNLPNQTIPTKKDLSKWKKITAPNLNL